MAIVDRPATQRFPTVARAGGRVVDDAPVTATLPRDRVRDLTALMLLAGCVFLVAALATFNAGDPPASRVFPPQTRATNACGMIGSTIAAGLYEALGLGAWMVAALLAGLDWALLRRRPLPDLPLRTAAAALALAAVCTLLTMFLPDWVDRPLWGPGGRIGGLGRLFAETYLARTGAAIMVTAVAAGGLFMAADAAILLVGS
ncbi:MAG: hypothetical protein EBR23_08410, partial [Planctomycetia bacterium]|nr:hypothetical protein [Planctomycetia bacterium]